MEADRIKVMVNQRVALAADGPPPAMGVVIGQQVGKSSPEHAAMGIPDYAVVVKWDDGSVTMEAAPALRIIPELELAPTVAGYLSDLLDVLSDIRDQGLPAEETLHHSEEAVTHLRSLDETVTSLAGIVDAMADHVQQLNQSVRLLARLGVTAGGEVRSDGR